MLQPYESRGSVRFCGHVGYPQLSPRVTPYYAELFLSSRGSIVRRHTSVLAVEATVVEPSLTKTVLVIALVDTASFTRTRKERTLEGNEESPGCTVSDQSTAFMVGL